MRIHIDNNRVETYHLTRSDGSTQEGHHYEIWLNNGKSPNIQINFQEGPVKDNGVNGITNEALLAILAHRIRFLNAGPFACRENSLALTKIEEAAHWLESRTKDRLSRGVEGENKV
jgi:hypothetical protein